MASLHQLILYIYLFFHLICSTTSNQDQTPQPYVVYMGRSLSSGDSSNVELSESAHLKLLSSIIPSDESERISLIHSYTHAFKGFSAMLTKKEASILSGHDEIVSVFVDPVLKLHTTRSWDFLAAQSGIRPPVQQYGHASRDVIIGMIDTGIWPESPSFNDEGMGEIPSRWKGVCMEGYDFKATNCNRKLIGARYYNTQDISIQGNTTTKTQNQIHSKTQKPKGSPRDTMGHGTHTTSIAAGTTVHKASYFGLAQGSAHGGSPSSRIACYKACSDTGCSGSTILKAIDDAVKDGVDIISISIGLESVVDFLNDPVAIGAFHAQQKGVFVICSGGNDGPEGHTVVNTAPWIFTVGASSIDRAFRSSVVLGDGRTFRGSAINFSNLTKSKTYALAFGETVAISPSTPTSEARNCYPGSLDPKKIAGKIVICVNEESTIPRRIKRLVLEDAKAKGLILIDEEEEGVPMDSNTFPFTQVGNFAGSQILKYMNSTKNPTATITPTVEVPRIRPAPIVAFFSSRGPGTLTENILKPDIMAPGVAILGALSPMGEEEEDRKTLYGIRSGTSMACPHVTGAAAFIKSIHFGWTSSMIKSALMTTATISNNMGKPIPNEAGKFANPHEMGVGEISPLKALNPGLVFETTNQDYLNFLCFQGYPQKAIQALSHTKFTCPKTSNVEKFISNINYPSISIGKLRRQAPATVKRIVTNVGSPNASYVASVKAPTGLMVKISPMKLVFVEGLKRANFRVSFDGKNASRGYNFGAVTWFDGSHLVRVVFAVNIA